MRLKILSLNVRGLGTPIKVTSLCNELNLLNFDIVLLQETHVSCPKQAKTFERSWRGKCYWSFGTGKSAGVAVLLPPHFSGSVQRFLFDSDGRILSLLFTFGLSCKLNLINIYAPNVVSERKTFFEQIHDFFLSKGDYLIAGDFNCVDRAIDKFQSDNVLSSDKSCLAALKADFSLVDVYRKLNPHGISFTWSNKNNTQVSRLVFSFRNLCLTWFAQTRFYLVLFLT